MMTEAEEIEKLRELLWLLHGHEMIYGDDGERQCGKCGLDFKRDSVERIAQHFYEEGLKDLRRKWIEGGKDDDATK